MRKKKVEGTVLEENISARVAKDTYDALKTEAVSRKKTMSTLVREIAEVHVATTSVVAGQSAGGE